MTNVLSDLGVSIISTIFYIIASLIDIILLPINALFSIFIPNYNDLLNNFNDFLVFYASVPFNYFLHLIPPLTRGILIFYLSLVIAYYTLIFSYRAFVLIPDIIRKIKFW